MNQSFGEGRSFVGVERLLTVAGVADDGIGTFGSGDADAVVVAGVGAGRVIQRTDFSGLGN